ncbi:MAG: SusD/RagB family nutrient-binding outer membrane lipoprotein [Dysgonamonadaceae bacterium]|jgi:hypothetical protein|nr:SusD/RagB family nutrient-binding outer membrane lipoprotein [Dysgonamonadaceae bacterium]
MKQVYSIRILLTILLTGTVLCCCTDNFSDINHPGTPSREEVKGDFYYIGVHFRALQLNVIMAEQNAYQFNENLTGQPYARYLTITKDVWNEQNFGVFNAPESWLNSVFNDQMVFVHSPWFELQRILKAEDKLDHYSWAWAELLRVAAIHRTTDMYGPLPYSALKQNRGDMHVAYDTQQAVYQGLFDDLNRAIDILTEYIQSGGASEVSSFSEYDFVYNGDFTKWVKFANSLKLRMAMRIAFVDPATSEKYAKEAVSHPIGVITSNDDNAWLHFSPNPLFIMQGAYADTRAGAELVCYMKGYRDPRLPVYFLPAQGSSEYKALRIGIKSKNVEWAKSFSCPNVKAEDPLLWMCAAEVAFLKAEAVAYWNWDLGGGESAETLYNRGIRLSFEQWGVSGYADYIADTTSKPANYDDDDRYAAPAPSNTTIHWDDHADSETKLERIITQKWIAIYPLGHEAWAEQRRTGYPRFFPVPVVNNVDKTLGIHGASRIPYGPQESLDNTANYNDAVANKGLGGQDVYGVRLWWDAKKPKAGWEKNEE